MDAMIVNTSRLHAGKKFAAPLPLVADQYRNYRVVAGVSSPAFGRGNGLN
jgi:hypothetical protein